MPITAVTAPLITGGIESGLSLLRSAIRSGQLRRAREIISGLPIPDIEKLQYEATLMEDPEKLIPIIQSRTEMEQIQEDPRLRQAQFGALQGLQDVVAGGGYTTAERGQLDAAMTDALTRQRGALDAEQSAMRRRGMGDSGLGVALGRERRQAGVTGASRAGFDVAQGGMQRKLQALQATGGLGGQIRGQEFGQQAQTKAAQDAINRANIQSRMGSQQFNIQQQQEASARNQAAINEQKARNAQAELNRAQMEQEKARLMAGTYGG